jgi:S-adenosylmethionine:tRNA-ribosyltransferase-isomerase (queuine synthetase)
MEKIIDTEPIKIEIPVKQEPIKEAIKQVTEEKPAIVELDSFSSVPLPEYISKDISQDITRYDIDDNVNSPIE